MNDNKPIEAGCRAIIIKSMAGNDGKIVTIIRRIGNVDGFDHSFGYRWEVDTTLRTSQGTTANHVAEGQLRRIDNYGGNNTSSWEEIQDIWSPEKVTSLD